MSSTLINAPLPHRPQTARGWAGLALSAAMASTGGVPLAVAGVTTAAASLTTMLHKRVLAKSQ